MGELAKEVLRLAESGQLATINKLILDTEARIEKLERAVESARKYADAGIKYRLSKMSESELAGFYNYLFSSLEALDSIGDGDE